MRRSGTDEKCAMLRAGECQTDHLDSMKTFATWHDAIGIQVATDFDDQFDAIREVVHGTL